MNSIGSVSEEYGENIRDAIHEFNSAHSDGEDCLYTKLRSLMNLVKAVKSVKNGEVLNFYSEDLMELEKVIPSLYGKPYKEFKEGIIGPLTSLKSKVDFCGPIKNPDEYRYSGVSSDKKKYELNHLSIIIISLYKYYGYKTVLDFTDGIYY